MDPTGRAWLSSEAILPSGDLRTQPEVAAALDRRITYETRPGNSGAVMLYVAAPIVEDDHLLSIVSLWEIVVKTSLGKLPLGKTIAELVRDDVQGNGIELL